MKPTSTTSSFRIVLISLLSIVSSIFLTLGFLSFVGWIHWIDPLNPLGLEGWQTSRTTPTYSIALPPTPKRTAARNPSATEYEYKTTLSLKPPISYPTRSYTFFIPTLTFQFIIPTIEWKLPTLPLSAYPHNYTPIPIRSPSTYFILRTPPTFSPLKSLTPTPIDNRTFTFSPIPTSNILVGGGEGILAMGFCINGLVISEIDAVSPDGSQFISLENSRGGIYLFKSPDFTKEKLDIPYNNWNPSWSPDGKRLIFESQGVLGAFLVFNISNTTYAFLTDHDGEYIYGRNPTWSPDGGKVAFFSGGIWTLERAFGTKKKLTLSKIIEVDQWNIYKRYWENTISWTKDGMWIAFIQPPGEIKRVSTIGTGEEDTIITTKFHIESIAYSPDGNWIAIRADEGEFLIRSDGTELTQLNIDKTCVGGPNTWQP